MKQSREEWERRALDELKAESLDHVVWRTPEGIEVKPLYTVEDLDGLEHLGSLPGFVPYTRGPHATMYSGRPWTVRQYAGFSTAEETNSFYRSNLAAGQTGLSVAFDLPTHRGFDSDHPEMAGDVGQAGVAIDTVEDMKILFDRIPLDRVTVSMTMNGAVLPIAAMFVVAAEELGVARADLNGTLQNDILKEFLVRNTYIYPPDASMRIVADVIQFMAKEMPNFNSVSISGYHMQEAGATAVQELALTVADGIEYVRAAIARGLAVDAFAPRLSFFFGVGMNFFMEVAKLRAARLLWAGRMQRHFQPADPRSLMLRTHCQTSGVSLTSRDPHNNIVRTTIEALAAAMGGTQSLHTNSFDEALALPTEASARVARNTQLILQEEAGMTRVIDPLAGSYYVESLTDSIARHADALVEEIETLGGMTQAIRSGMPQGLIEDSAARRQARVDRGEDVVVGVNKYAADAEPEISVRSIDNSKVLSTQQRRLTQTRQARDDSRCRQALNELAGAAQDPEKNLLDLSIAAARARATVGEITAALEKVYGRHRESRRATVGVYGASYANDAKFKAIQGEVNKFAEAHGRRPRMLIVKLGQDGHDRGAKVIASAFADIGFDVDIGPLFQTPQGAVKQAIENDVHIIGISSQAAGHRTLVPQLMDALRESEIAGVLVVCGGVIPPQDHAHLREIGVAAIYGPGTNIPQAALEILKMIEGGEMRNVEPG